MLVVGVSIPVDLMRSHPQAAQLKTLYDNAAIQIKQFLEIVVNNYNTTKVMIDCTWMPLHYTTLRSSHITDFLTTIYLPRREMSIMLDFGLNSVERSVNFSVDTLIHEIDTKLQENATVHSWYTQKVQILWPIQPVFFERQTLKKQPGPAQIEEEEHRRQMFLFGNTDQPAFWPYLS